MMMVGKSERRRSFKGKYGHELGIDYYFNYKAWMTQTLFFDWLKRLDKYVSLASDRNILLLPDNCTAHEKIDNAPQLSHIVIFFLPPNTTSKLQPLDAGIIATVKGMYRRRLLFRVFENVEAGRTSIYNIDVLTAIRWITEE